MTVDTEETERFCRMFDKFFDIFNTRVIEENIRKKKPNLKPFYGDDDSRLKVSISAFLMDNGYHSATVVGGRYATIFKGLGKVGKSGNNHSQGS